MYNIIYKKVSYHMKDYILNKYIANEVRRAHEGDVEYERVDRNNALWRVIKIFPTDIGRL